MVNLFELMSKKEEKYSEIGRLSSICVEEIVENPNQPRKYFNEDELNSLAESIKQNGLIQPITVRELEKKEGIKKYELISGERRLKAAKIVGLSYISAIIIRIEERESAVIALVENVQRSDLSYFEEAEAIGNIIKIYNLTQDELAARLGKSQSTIANKIRLLRLGEEERKLIIGGSLTERHARAFLRITDDNKRIDCINKVINRKLTVQQTDEMVEKILSEEVEKRKFNKRKIVLRELRLYENSIKEIVKQMSEVGLGAKMERRDNDKWTEYVITVKRDEKDNKIENVPRETVLKAKEQ